MIPEEEQFQRIENMIRRERRIPQEIFVQAVHFLQEQVAKDEKNIRAYENLAYLYNHRAASDHAEASEYAERWQAYCDRADRMKKLGYIAEAIADYERCMQIQEKPRLAEIRLSKL